MGKPPTVFIKAAITLLALLGAASVFAAKPALTQDVDSPARHGVTASCAGTETPQQQPLFVEQCTLYTVPAGHIFVLETFNAVIQDSSIPLTVFPISLTAPNGANYSILAAPVSFALQFWSVLAPLKSYYPSGTVISASVVVSAAANSTRTSNFIVSGYLVSE